MRQIVLHLCAFLALQGFKRRVFKTSPFTYFVKSKGELRCIVNSVLLDGKVVVVFFFFNLRPKSEGGGGGGTLAYSPPLLLLQPWRAFSAKSYTALNELLNGL